MADVLRAHADKINARAKPLALAIARVLASYAEYLGNQAASRKLKLRKMSDSEFEQELYETLKKYGLRHLDSSGKLIASALGGEFIIRPSLLEDIIREKKMRVKIIGKTIREAVNETVRDILTAANKQDIPPTAGGLAQTIRDGVKNIFEVTPQRAMLIARTESVVTEGLAKYEVTSTLERPGFIKRKKWLALKNDGRSGKRMHWRMKNKVIDFDELFVTPLGNEMMYPGDPNAPIDELANCRCEWVIVWSEEK